MAEIRRMERLSSIEADYAEAVRLKNLEYIKHGARYKSVIVDGIEEIRIDDVLIMRLDHGKKRAQVEFYIPSEGGEGFVCQAHSLRQGDVFLLANEAGNARYVVDSENPEGIRYSERVDISAQQLGTDQFLRVGLSVVVRRINKR